MYSSNGCYNALRLHNPSPDPAEHGPPKRIGIEDTQIGERIAASKRQISWKFTLGESDRIREVALVHSVLSYKKVVSFDRACVHRSNKMTPGDWTFVMILDGSNHVIEVRINDIENSEIPKYDLLIDRIPYRKWDVYTRLRSKQMQSDKRYNSSTGYPQAEAGQRWGPEGYTPNSLPSAINQNNNLVPTIETRQSSPPNYDPPPTYQKEGQSLVQHEIKKQKPEVNLMDFGAEVVSIDSVPIKQALFDPLVNMNSSQYSTSIGVQQPLVSGNGVQKSLNMQQAQWINSWTNSETWQPSTTEANNSIPLYPVHDAYPKFQQVQPLPPPLYHTAIGTTFPSTGFNGVGYAPPRANALGNLHVNMCDGISKHNISTLMNPIEMQTTTSNPRPIANKSINIDPFAAMNMKPTTTSNNN